ncbi:MAG: response regulator [Maricaulaceae bacterium]|jgi:DNA-binding NarL/FixJ family response regulator
MASRYKSCLIVDDDRLIAELLRQMLEQMGVTDIEVAHDGPAAIEMAIKKRPDVVFMDVRLGSDLNGVDAAAEIVKKCSARVVFVTAHNDSLTLERMARSNPSGILIKPVDTSVIKQALTA